MSVTRAASKVLLRQYHNGSNDHRVSPRTTICSIPNEVLLEIFDSFRQSFRCEDDYERAWNSNKGWFKLAHVCREWRQLVLTSPSRLYIRLLFTGYRFGTALAIRRLPPLPIVVDYRSGAWTVNTQLRMISALSYPDRVCGIAFNMCDRQSRHSSKLWAAMNQPFPALKSLEFYWPGDVEPHSPPPFLTTQTTHLRSLKFTGGVTGLSRVLPYATSLVDLTFRLHAPIVLPLDTRLLVHLQGLTSLHRLKVETLDAEMPNLPGRRDNVLLPMLTSLSFFGSIAFLDTLMDGLAAPSLQELRISVFPRAILPPTHLTSFIRNSGSRVFSAQLNATEGEINLVMSTNSHSTGHPSFKFVASGMRSIKLLGDLFSEALSTVDDVFLVSPFCLETLASPIQDAFHSNTFLTSFRSAKIIRVSPGVESKVGEILCNEDISPDLLPALEEIELNAPTASCKPIRIDKEEVVSILESFKPFVDARQRVGHPVKVHWNTDRVLPEYFCNTDM